MDTTFLYAECARRKAQKKRMLEAGEAGLKSRPVTTQDDPVPEHRPPRPPAARSRVQVRGVHMPGAAAPPPPQPQA
ncbi:MAG: hypothetical protein HY721_09055, partial [Planctomycetes bacterium]|nr:hypothetical protein [Planctomycetota bacterium]